jgi:hypothetical protein
LIVIFIFSACSSSSNIRRPQIKPEIDIKILHEKGIVVKSPNYKRSYFKRLPYLLYNENNNFNEFIGDYINVKNEKVSNFNITAGYSNEYGKHNNSLIVLIAMNSTSKPELKNTPISVSSHKHGAFSKEIDQYQRILFYKKLKLENEYDIINKVLDDFITVNVGGQIYRFVNPEFQLD